MRQKKIYFFLVIILIILSCRWLTPTYAKFSNDYETDKDIVGLNLNFNVKVSNIEEYEVIKVDAKSYEVYNINISNDSDDLTYYGVWYKMVKPIEINDDIIIARLEDNPNKMTDELEGLKDTTVSIIVKNNTTNDIIMNIGVANSSIGINEIEYLGGKRLITGTSQEIDYSYEEGSQKYISVFDNNTYFKNVGVLYDINSPDKTFVSNHDGIYLIEAWSAKDKEKAIRTYMRGIIRLKENTNLYLKLGSTEEKKDTEVHVTNEEISELDDRIMVASLLKDNTYLSGHLGGIAPNLTNEMKEICKTGEEDIRCSYHYSGMYFENTKIINDSNEKIIKNDTVNENNNGYIRISPIVPTVEVPEIKVKMGNEMDVSNITCVDNGTGCNFIKIKPENISELAIGTYKLTIIVSDDFGFVYRYFKNIEIIE